MEEHLNHVRRLSEALNKANATLVLFDSFVSETIFLLEHIWQLPDPFERIVLLEFYIMHHTLWQIAEECKTTTKTVYRVKRAAINELEKLWGNHHREKALTVSVN